MMMRAPKSRHIATRFDGLSGLAAIAVSAWSLVVASWLTRTLSGGGGFLPGEVICARVTPPAARANRSTATATTRCPLSMVSPRCTATCAENELEGMRQKLMYDRLTGLSTGMCRCRGPEARARLFRSKRLDHIHLRRPHGRYQRGHGRGAGEDGCRAKQGQRPGQVQVLDKAFRHAPERVKAGGAHDDAGHDNQSPLQQHAQLQDAR